MTDEQKTWIIAKNRMIDALTKLGFPEVLGDQIVKNLGSPKAMVRMTSYLNNVKPKKAELVVDEMLAVSHIVVNDYECGERTCRRMDMRGRFLIALISQGGKIRKKANGLMQRIMKFFILGLKTFRMTRIKERRKFAHYFFS